MDYSNEQEPKTEQGIQSKNLKLLQTLIDKILKGLENDSYQPKVRDGILAIKLIQQVSKSSEAEGIFWEMIHDISKSELSPPTTVEDQIKNAISSLAHQVKNGILPVKIINDTFNQERDEQKRLTCRRMCGLLTSMGFTKVRTSSGASAIIWEDSLIRKRIDESKYPSLVPDPANDGEESEDRSYFSSPVATTLGLSEIRRDSPGGCPQQASKRTVPSPLGGEGQDEGVLHSSRSQSCQVHDSSQHVNQDI